MNVPTVLVDVQEAMRLFAQRLFEILVVKRFNALILMRKANRHIRVKIPQSGRASFTAFATLVNWLAAPVGATAGTRHNFDEIVLDVAALKRV